MLGSVPYFMYTRPDSLEVFQTCRGAEDWAKVKPAPERIDLARISMWLDFAPLPHEFLEARRYAIFYSGSSNCRHVNDMEFLYRTLIDVYGFEAEDIYVLNRDGTLSWSPHTYSNGFTEPSPPCDYPVDNSAFRLQVSGAANRAGFQDVIEELTDRIEPFDVLFIHTNNHGGWDEQQEEGFLPGWWGINERYYANDFAEDLGGLPSLATLLVMMEPCHSGAFLDPILNNSPAHRTVVQSSVPWNENSAGRWFFDPWAEMWISALAGVRGNGTALTTTPDANSDTAVSAAEAFDYAFNIDNPQMVESSADLSEGMFIG